MLIYRVTNLVNGKVYIGKYEGTRVQSRWKTHLSEARRGSPYYLHNAIRKYGPEAFAVEVIDNAAASFDLVERERFHIAQHQSFKPEIGYNSTMGGEGILGFKHTLETRKKTSETLMGHEVSSKTREKLSKVQIGKEIPYEVREKISSTLKGRPLSAKNREGIRNAWTPERRAAQIERGRALGKANAH